MDRKTITIVGAIVATIALGLTGGLLFFGGGDDATATSVTAAAAPTSTPTTTPPSTTTRITAAPRTTTTVAPTTTTTTEPGPVVDIDLGEPDRLSETVTDLYEWLADPDGVKAPPMSEAFAARIKGVTLDEDIILTGDHRTARLSDGITRIGVATAGDDVVLLVDEGDRWEIVGAKLTSLGMGPEYGPPVRFVMVIGSDARPGQSQPEFRADSIHIVSSVAAAGSGAVVGFPRDTRVEADYGFDKYTHVNVYSGTEEMVRVARDLTGVPIEGYIITGFLGFEDLVDAFGGVMVDVPFAMAEPKSKAYLDAGLQLLKGSDALAFSRNRKSVPGGDFGRSFHQGLVILGGLTGAQEQGVLEIPNLLRLLDKFTWTDLSPAQLVTLAAAAYEIDGETVTNIVLPGSVRTISGASVVVLDSSAQDIFDDLADGLLTPTDG